MIENVLGKWSEKMKFVFTRPEPMVRQRIVEQMFSLTYIAGLLPMSLSYENVSVCFLQNTSVKMSSSRSYPNWILNDVLLCFLTIATGLQTNGVKNNFISIANFSVMFVASLQTNSVNKMTWIRLNNGSKCNNIVH